VERLQGMFAFAVWDELHGRLLIARDRVGIKPLFYSTGPHSLLFASEIKGLIQDPALDQQIDPLALDRYFSFGFIPAPDTIFRSVKKLLPGHLLIWENNSVRVERYYRYRPAAEHAAKNERAWLSDLRDTLRNAVRKQMVSDVPLGAFLSGGIDSSLVVWMMSQCSDHPVRTFNIGFEQQDWSEAPHARLVASTFGTDHREYEVSPDTVDILPKLVWHFDEPFADSSMLPTYYVSKITRQEVTVALSGDGGDELFAGYTRHQGERISQLFRTLPSWMRSGIVGVLTSSPAARQQTMRRMGRVLADAQLDFFQRYQSKQSICPPHLKATFLSGAFQSYLGATNDVRVLEQLGQSTSHDDFITRLTVLDLEFYLPNDMLVKVDRMSMASSLEVRVPFLDEDVVDVASRVPNQLKLRGLTTKYLLRKLTSEALPPSIWRRGKQGFGIPIHKWFRGDLTGHTREVLLDQRTIARGYFQRDGLERILRAHELGQQDHGHLIFAMLCFELWCRGFIDSKGSERVQLG
jgi:asparagine synthase (glutamine-hydrolysing)